MTNASEIFKLADDWSNGDPESAAEIAVGLDRLYQSAYAEGFKAGLGMRPIATSPQAEKEGG